MIIAIITTVFVAAIVFDRVVTRWTKARLEDHDPSLEAYDRYADNYDAARATVNRGSGVGRPL